MTCEPATIFAAGAEVLLILSLRNYAKAFRVGIAGPVGSGKTALLDCMSKRVWPRVNLAVRYQ